MQNFFKFLVTIFFVTVMIWLSVINRASFDFSLAPFSTVDISIPFPLIMLACVFFGFVWGALIVWLNGANIRSESRRLKRELKELEHSEKNIG